MTDTRLRRAETGAVVSIVVCILLVIAAALPPGMIRVHLFAILSSAVPLMFLRRRWGGVSLLLLAVPMSLILWSILTLIVGAISIELFGLLPWLVAGGCVAVVIWQHYFLRRNPFIRWKPTPSEWCALAFALFGFGMEMILALHNGYVAPSTPGGHSSIALGGWAIDDTLYFCALAEQILLRGHLPVENPFLAGIGNYYPSFCHAGLAGIAQQSGQCVFTAVCSWMVSYGAMSLGLMVLVAGRIGGSVFRWRGALFGAFATAVVYLLRFSMFTYPLTHFMLMPVLMLCVWFLADLKPRATAGRRMAIAFALIFVMVLSHTISAVIASALVFAIALRMILAPATRRMGIKMAIGLCVIAVALAAVNSYPYAKVYGYTEIVKPWQMIFTSSVLEEFLVMLLCLIPLCLMRGKSAASVRLFYASVFAAGILYTLQGILCPDNYIRWFRMYNAPRFWQIGLLFILPSFALIGRRSSAQRRIGIAFASVIFLLAFFPLFCKPPEFVKFICRFINLETPLFVNPAEEGSMHYIRTHGSATDSVSMPVKHLAAGLTGRAELAADHYNLWGVDTLTPQTFEGMREEYNYLWKNDDCSTATINIREGILALSQIRWLIELQRDDSSTTETAAQLLAKYNEGTVEFVMSDKQFLLFKVKLETFADKYQKVDTH